MSNLDSRTATTMDESLERGEQWGQPPASHYVFSHEADEMRWYLAWIFPTSSSYAFPPLKAPESTLDSSLEDWDTLSDEELAALYDEAAEEDLLLAESGLADYAAALRQEEESE